MKAIAPTLETIVGSNKVCSWDNLATESQHRLIQTIVPGMAPSYIVYPQTQAELAEVVACADLNKLPMLPFGSATKIGWGGLPSKIALMIGTQGCDRLIEHAVGDLTVTVEAGMKFAHLQNILATHNQFIALDPAYSKEATIGGIVATADAGSLRHRYGGVRDMLLGITLVRADGKIAKAGGRVVKNVAGYDLMKLFTGSWGTLGIITQVTLRVYPQPEASATVVLTGTATAIDTAAKTLLASALTPTAVDLLSTSLVEQLLDVKGMGLITRFQSVSPSVKQQCDRVLEVAQHLGLQSIIYSDKDETQLWQNLKQQMESTPTSPAITCKIGVLPTAATTILTKLDMASNSIKGLIHAGAGLGLIHCNLDLKSPTILAIREACQSYSGFLTILEATPAFKQQLDVWGYSGNGIDLMQKIKHQFDPENLLSPHRFVGNI